MNIGLLTTSFPRSEGDVPGQFVLGFARALAREGHRVTVLSPEPTAGFAPPPRSFEVEVCWVPYLRPRSLQRTFYGAGVLDNLRARPWSALGLVPFVASLARETARRAAGFDAVVSHWALPCALIAGALCPRVPHLAVLHSADVFLLERLPGRSLIAASIARGASALLFVSRALRTRFLDLLPPLERGRVAGRCHVCAMGIEPRAKPSAPRAKLRRQRALTKLSVLSLGRLIELKGIAHAIDAVAALEDVELIVAGAGPHARALRTKAERAGAPVRFVGETHGQEKTDLLCAADAFLLPSIVLASGRSEGMPTSVLEAMEHGLPVVASDVGGVRDVVRHGHNGFLVPAGNAAAIAQRLDALRSLHTRTRLGRNARRTAAQYHWSALGPTLCELLFQSGGAP